MIPLLAGLRVIDVTAVILGPYATQILGDLGADVIKVEPIDGDSMRAIHPVAEPGISALFANNNRNKRSLAIDLKSAAGKAVMTRLIASGDALVHNMRQDAFDRLGFGVAAARAINPRIVYCAAVGFGSNGPYAGRPAYDDVIQAMCGLAGLFEKRDGAPALAPSIVADKVVGLHVAYAVLAALLHRERHGGNGTTVEVPMFETMSAFSMNEHLDQASFAADGRLGYARALAPQRKPYRTADGWIAALPYTLGHWQRTLEAIGEAELAGVQWLRDPAERNRRAPQLYEVLERALAGRTTGEWLKLFEAIDVPCGRVNSPEALLEDEHLKAVGLFEPNFDGATPVVRTLNQSVRFDGADIQPDRPPPPLGSATQDLVRELGFSDAELADMIGAGAVTLTPSSSRNF
jgi:crotonobetainyl-CoA:carnitine CoA-transferase CaiB-like acyl-CoA transferase